jgi:hypothetical protein
MKDDVTLLTEINKAVAEVNAAQVEVASKSKAVGVLLLEAKKIHPKVKDFKAFLKRVDGLELSRAYDCMRLAGGRVTDDELRKDARERQQKSRAKKKIPKPAPKPLPDFRDVTESLPKPEPKTKPKPKQPASAISDAMHRVTGAGKSAFALREFTFACKSWLPQITVPDDQITAITTMREWLEVMAANKGRAA